MEKLYSRMSLIMALMIGATAFVACSSDDDDDEAPQGGGGETTSKRIAKITFEIDDESSITTFEYDSQGRVVKKNETYGYNGNYNSTTTYTYGENTITSYGDDNIVCTYTLSNGLVTKWVEEYKSDYYPYSYTYDCTYDSNGHIITLQGTDNEDFTWTWTDGNLTKLSKKGSYSFTISYSNISWPQNWMHYWKGTNIDRVLEPLGAWGKMPKNLPTKFVRVYDNGKTNGWTIDYTIENGDITKAIFQDLDGANSPEIYTFEWE